MTESREVAPGLVSVVICSYNNWPDVEMAIKSALHQTYPLLEVIVVDNSSTDATPREVPRHFGDTIRYLRQPNRECAGAYNTGFDVARGEFIQFMDGDDVLAPNKIAKQVEVFRALPELEIVYGDVRKFQAMAGAVSWEDLTTQPEDDMLSALLAGGKHGIGTLGSLFRRSVVERVGRWDESLYCEDTDYYLRAAYAGCRFGHCPGSPMGFARIRPGQKTANNFALDRGFEVVLEKALGYVTREPYRSLLAAKLAQQRFIMAVSRRQMTTRDALAKLALARSTSPDTVAPLAYAVAYATIVLPGGAALVRSRMLRPLRRAAARLLDYRVSE